MSKFKSDLLKTWNQIENSLKEFREEKNIDSGESKKRDDFAIQCEDFENHISNLVKNIEILEDAFSNYSEEKLKDFNSEELNKDFFHYYNSIDDSIFDRNSKSYKAASSIHYLISDLGEESGKFLRNFIHCVKKEIHFLADPAKGKTHISCDIAYKNIERQRPVIFLTGDKFTNETSITESIKKNLDIPTQYTFEDFIQALDIYGSINNSKIPIIIDGLNETTFNRLFSPIWKNHLDSLIEKTSKSQNVVVITTCRNSYKNRVWDKGVVCGFQELHGFENYEVIEEAVNKYFLKYKIKSDIQFANLEKFSEPIFLKIFCEIKNPNFASGEEVTVNLDEESTFGIFDEYLNQINQKVTSSKSILREGENFIQKNLNKLAVYLWENNLREIEIDKFYELIDGNKPYEKDSSKADILIDEGLIINRDMRSDEEYVSFTYDLLAGYMIAKDLLNKTSDNKFFISDGFIERIVNGEYQHPLYEDIMYSLCLLLPQSKQTYLHDLLENNGLEELSENEIYKEYKKYGFSKSVTSLFKLPTRYVEESAVNLISELFQKKENQPIFFSFRLKL